MLQTTETELKNSHVTVYKNNHQEDDLENDFDKTTNEKISLAKYDRFMKNVNFGDKKYNPHEILTKTADNPVENQQTVGRANVTEIKTKCQLKFRKAQKRSLTKKDNKTWHTETERINELRCVTSYIFALSQGDGSASHSLVKHTYKITQKQKY